MADMAQIKKQLKDWESAFFVVHQRKPGKDDINNAPDNIKDLYRTYHSARKTGSSQANSTQQESKAEEQRPTRNVAETESSEMASVWGAQFNRKPATNTSTGGAHTGSGVGKRGSTLLNKLGDKLSAKCSTPPPVTAKTRPSFPSRVKSAAADAASGSSEEALTGIREHGRQLQSSSSSSSPSLRSHTGLSSTPSTNTNTTASDFSHIEERSASKSQREREKSTVVLGSPHTGDKTTAGFHSTNQSAVSSISKESNDNSHSKNGVQSTSLLETTTSESNSHHNNTWNSAASKNSLKGEQNGSFSSSTNDDSEFRVKGAMFERALKLATTGKKRGPQGDQVDVARKFLPSVSGRTNMKLSVGRDREDGSVEFTNFDSSGLDLDDDNFPTTKKSKGFTKTSQNFGDNFSSGVDDDGFGQGFDDEDDENIPSKFGGGGLRKGLSARFPSSKLGGGLRQSLSGNGSSSSKLEGLRKSVSEDVPAVKDMPVDDATSYPAEGHSRGPNTGRRSAITSNSQKPQKAGRQVKGREVDDGGDVIDEVDGPNIVSKADEYDFIVDEFDDEEDVAVKKCGRPRRTAASKKTTMRITSTSTLNTEEDKEGDSDEWHAQNTTTRKSHAGKKACPLQRQEGGSSGKRKTRVMAEEDSEDEEKKKPTKGKRRVGKVEKTLLQEEEGDEEGGRGGTGGGGGCVKGKRKQNSVDNVDHRMVEEEDRVVQRPPKRPKIEGTGNISQSRKTENFVRLNMKVKRFVRKGRGMTGGQYKRKQWKEKMAARNKSRGNACFKCGQEGHWANKCPGKQSDAGMMMETEVTPVDEESFPSLMSAANMARGGNSQETSTQAMEFGADQELAVEAMVVRERFEPKIHHSTATPFSHLVSDVSAEMKKGLKKFGFSSFKKGQQESITRILNGESTLVVLSTGGGKSLCYQLPAVLYAQKSRGITLVVSPLVSLMEDQVTGLPPGVRGACLHSNMTPAQRDAVLSDVSAGTVHFLLVSPEAVVGGGGGRGGQGSFPKADKLPPIFFACIDEVHCLSEWSHNFRPCYLRLCKVLREQYGVSCFLGLTATATRRTASDIQRHLGIAGSEEATVRGSPVPPNLQLSVSRDDNKDEALVNLLQGKRLSACESIIIYCTRRQQVERVATLMRTCLPSTDTPDTKTTNPTTTTKNKTKKKPLWTVESYHAGLTPAKRKRVQKGFMEGRVRVVVATVAFGMGLDKADVRAVIHYNLPKSFENYVQEIGRAGRDGEISHCHLFLDPRDGDVTELQRHTFSNALDRVTVKKLLYQVFQDCRCRQIADFQNPGGQKEDSAVSEEPGTRQQSQTEPPAEQHRHSAGPSHGQSPISGPSEEQSPTSGPSEEQSSNSGPSEDPSQNADPSLLERSPTSGPSDEPSSNSRPLEEQCRIADLSEEPRSPKSAQPSDRAMLGPSSVQRQRLCPGHERALVMAQLVQDLDMREEGVETLLSYLELHVPQLLTCQTPVYATCQLQCYGGPRQLQAVAHKCPPVAVAIARQKLAGEMFAESSSVTFPVVELSDSMGWDSGPVKRELKALQWTVGDTGARKSGVMVTFSDLAFRLRSVGDVTEDERDALVDFLHGHCSRQQKRQLRNLALLASRLRDVSHKNYWMCADQVDADRSQRLKQHLDQHFNSMNDDDDNGADVDDAEDDDEEDVDPQALNQLTQDIRQFYQVYGSEHRLTGRSVARVFHGIDSPRFPATTWGRVRRYWRCSLHLPFPVVLREACRQLLMMR